MENASVVDYNSVWKECISREEALHLYLSHDSFGKNTNNNKDLYRSINKKTLMPTQKERSFCRDWYDASCLLHYWLKLPTKQGQILMRTELSNNEKGTKVFKDNAAVLENQATKEAAVRSIPEGTNIADSITAARAQDEADKDHDHDNSEIDDNTANNNGINKEITNGTNSSLSNGKIPEWKNDLALQMMLALSIDETISKPHYKHFLSIFPRSKELGASYKPTRKILFSDPDNPMNSMKRAYDWITTKKNDQNNLFKGQPWFDKSQNEKAKMEKMMGIEKVLSFIEANADREGIATSLDWYNLVYQRTQPSRISRELMLRVYLHLDKNDGKPDMKYLDQYLYKIRQRDTTLLGRPIQLPSKIIYCDNRFEEAMTKVIEYLTSAKAVQKLLSIEANQKYAKEAEVHRKALFAPMSLLSAISSVQTGQMIVAEVGWELREEEGPRAVLERSNVGEVDHAGPTNNAEKRVFVGLASSAEARVSIVETNVMKLKKKNEARVKKFDTIKNPGQLALSRNRELEDDAKLATARFCDAVANPVQEGSGTNTEEPFYHAMFTVYTNVEMSKSSGGRVSKTPNLLAKPRCTIVSRNREARKKIFEVIFAENKDPYDLSFIQENANPEDPTQSLTSQVEESIKSYKGGRAKPRKKRDSTEVVLENTLEGYKTPAQRRLRSESSIKPPSQHVFHGYSDDSPSHDRKLPAGDTTECTTESILIPSNDTKSPSPSSGSNALPSCDKTNSTTANAELTSSSSTSDDLPSNDEVSSAANQNELPPSYTTGASTEADETSYSS